MPSRGLAVLLAVLISGVAVASDPRVVLELDPTEATVGDALRLTLTLELPADAGFEPSPIGPRLGPFSVVGGAWDGPLQGAGATAWVWRGSIAAFRPGALELPAIRLRVEREEGEAETLETPARSVLIRSVLPPEGPDDEAELADLKPPASIRADYGALLVAAVILTLLLGFSALLWWLHRRYAARLGAVPTPVDAFQRMPAHVWVYGELGKLLERRLAEQGHVDRFFAELSRILKLYLSGRYRVDLMERTTAEVPPPLRQAGAAEEPIAAIGQLLERCDRVKFAGEQPSPEACRAAVEEAYRIIDATRPADARAAEARERGAA